MMTLPHDLISALEKQLANTSRSVLAHAAADLTSRYRSAERDKLPAFMTSDQHRLSYLAVRMPATFTAVKKVLQECKKRISEFEPKSLCDVGAGPGTASWAAMDMFPGIENITLHEKDSGLLKIGQSLMEQSSQVSLRKGLWHKTDLLLDTDFAVHDLVIMSYVVGELPPESMLRLVSKAWDAASNMLVIIEPGTPHGFERIRLIREQLLKSGAFIVAPCPHHQSCPMADGDWCHFSARLERSFLHKSVKDVSLGYEDEKYAYIAFSKTPVTLPEARILRHPAHHSGHSEFVLCSKEKLEKRTFSRRQKDLYKQAKKLEWGDSLPNL